jgi:hypothetical protein
MRLQGVSVCERDKLESLKPRTHPHEYHFRPSPVSGDRVRLSLIHLISMAPSILFDDRVSDSFGQYHHELSKSPIKVQEWPRLFTSGLAWDPATFSNEQTYTYNITATHKLEIEHALEYFKCKF